jgi:hypothetical protein
VVADSGHTGSDAMRQLAVETTNRFRGDPETPRG